MEDVYRQTNKRKRRTEYERKMCGKQDQARHDISCFIFCSVLYGFVIRRIKDRSGDGRLLGF